VRGALSEPLVIDGAPVHVTATIGIAVDSEDTRTADHLLRRADVAVYSAERDGKGRHVLFEGPAHGRAVRQPPGLTAGVPPP